MEKHKSSSDCSELSCIVINSFAHLVGLFGPESIHAFSLGGSSPCFDDKESSLVVAPILADATERPLQLLFWIVLVLEDDTGVCYLQVANVDYSAFVINVFHFE